MRHRHTTKTFDRPASQRAMLRRNLAVSLIQHERITTTVAKAKWLRPFVERLVTKGKAQNLATRRLLLQRLNNKSAVRKLVNDLANRFKARQGGYLRITKSGSRKGDGAEQAIIEFVDRRQEAEVKVESKKSANSKSDKPSSDANKDSKKK
ncbi:MAG: 50S ribosomal protein L17 [bacterium]|nr:50S ribosomal protein L17 [bacterium]